jgi:hypothetical protein
MHPAAEQIPWGPHLCGIDIRLGEHPAAEEDGDLVRIDPIVCGLAPMNRLHVEGMAQNERNAFLGAEVRQPLPGKEAFDADDEILAVGSERFEKRLGRRFHLPVQQDLAGLVQDAEVHGAGVQVDPAVEVVLLGVEAHEVSSSP